MNTPDMRQQIIDLQKQLAAVESERTRAIAELAVLRAVLVQSSSLAEDVTALLNYAVQARQVQASFADLVAQLRAVGSVAEAKAIGNSVDALFRTTPVPAVLAGR